MRWENSEERLSAPSSMSLHQRNGIDLKKMGVVERVPEISGALTTTPLPGLCCCKYFEPHQATPQRYEGMYTFERFLLTVKLTVQTKKLPGKQVAVYRLD
jgi:hypothetical protein